MNKFLKRLNAGEIMVADGATGSNLQMMGIKPGTPPEDLVMDNPEIILNLATAFVEAAQILSSTVPLGDQLCECKNQNMQTVFPK